MLKLITKGKIALDDFRNDLEGASLIEYSVLIGLLTVAVVTTVGAVGTKIGLRWTALDGSGI